MRALCCCHWAVPATFCAPVNLTCLTLSPYSAIPNFCALASDLPRPQAPCPMPLALVALAANWAGGKDDIVMIPARWRCEISEALGPGHLPVHSKSTPTASAGLPLPQSPSSRRGSHTDDCVTSLPPRHCPAFPDTVAIVEAHQMRRPRPHLGASGVAAASLPPRLDRTRTSCPPSPAIQPSPDQAHVALMTAVSTLLRFRSRKTRQVGLRNGRSRHGPAAPPPILFVPVAVPIVRSASCDPMLQRITILLYG